MRVFRGSAFSVVVFLMLGQSLAGCKDFVGVAKVVAPVVCAVAENCGSQQVIPSFAPNPLNDVVIPTSSPGPGPVPPSAAPVTSGLAFLRILNPFPTFVVVTVDGVPFAQVMPGGYYQAAVPAGVHIVCAQIPGTFNGNCFNYQCPADNVTIVNLATF
jgi:hypothetical protein